MTTTPLDPSVHICVMGVSGVGKSTVGEALARRLRRRFCDADDLHSAAAVAKMAAGTPLTDADRAPWLDAVTDWLDAASKDGDGVVFACSALKLAYRERLARADEPVFFVHLSAPGEQLRRRLAERKGHFMKAELLRSQLATLEPLGTEEFGVHVPTAETVDETVTAVISVLRGM